MQQSKSETPVFRRAYHVKEAAAAYGLSRSTLYVMMANHVLRSVKVGGRRLIPVDAIEALLACGDREQPRLRNAPLHRIASDKDVSK